MKNIFRLIAVLLIVAMLPLTAFAEKVDTDDFDFPNDWSRDALMFAVENGILGGDENRNLNPANNITRAEMAAVLVRLLGASEETDLSQYEDVDSDAWYYSELSSAVAAGIFGGTSETTMHPMNPITREQAIVVLSRAFGIVSTEREAWSEFEDSFYFYDYSKDCVCAMIEVGAAKGYSDNTFNPQGYITRAEVASLLYNLLDVIADEPEEIPDEGFVLYRGEDELPEELELDGTLIIGPAAETTFCATRWEISDALILRTGANTRAELSGLTTEKLVCAPTGGKIEANAESVFLWGNGCRFEGEAAELYVVDGVQRADGTFENVSMRSGKLTLLGTATDVTMSAGNELVLEGNAETVTMGGMNAKLTGSGYAQTVVANRANCTHTVSYGQLDNSLYESYYKDHDTALDVVKTQRVPCTVEEDTDLFADQHLTEVIGHVPAGTTVYNEFHPAGDSFQVTYTDESGNEVGGWLYRWDCHIPDEEVVTWDSDLDYSDAIKEGFVNLKQYSSQTEYLIWINRYTQRVVVYTGTKGNWKVHKTFPCSSGANNTPTPQGVYEVEAHFGHWYFDYYMVYNATGFWGDTAFHSTLYNFDGTHFDERVGIPLSHGCIRMHDEDAEYIYDTIPMGTTVVVW